MKTKVNSIVGMTIYKLLLFLFIYTVFWRGTRRKTIVPEIFVHSVATTSSA